MNSHAGNAYVLSGDKCTLFHATKMKYKSSYVSILVHHCWKLSGDERTPIFLWNGPNSRNYVHLKFVPYSSGDPSIISKSRSTDSVEHAPKRSSTEKLKMDKFILLTEHFCTVMISTSLAPFSQRVCWRLLYDSLWSSTLSLEASIISSYAFPYSIRYGKKPNY